MKNDKKNRYATIMCIGILLDLGLYWFAHYFHLPMWLDSIGTAYVAVALEPTAGLLIAFLTNFAQSAFVYGTSSIVYYLVGALAALCFGIILREHGRIKWSKMPKAAFVYLVSATVMEGLLTMWRTGGLPDSRWERYFYELSIKAGFPNFLACISGAGALKLIDTVIIVACIPVFIRLTPKIYITEKVEDVVTRKKYL